MAGRCAEIGAPEGTARVWFSSLLRDGFALTSAGTAERFAVLGVGALHSVLSGVELTTDLDAATRHVMSGFSSLEVHPDVPDGIRALAESGARLVTLTNGSAEVAESLFTTAGIRQHFERLLSVDDAGVWKPAPGGIGVGARTCSADPNDMLLVASHPWDIDGAGRAGMRTCWVNRRDEPYPGYFRPPHLTVSALPDLARMVR